MLEVKDIYKKYDKKEVLKGVSFTCKRSEIVSLLGANGSGKTTVFKTVLNLIKADKGEVLLDGLPLNSSEIGYLPEERSLFHDCSIERQLRLLASMKGQEKEETLKNMHFWLDWLKIREYENQKPYKLSKGNQQKVQLAMALIGDPSCLIMDEPWTGLDKDNINIFQKTLLEMKRRNCVVLLSSHQHQQVQDICDRYLYLKDGKIIINITRKQLLDSPYRIVSIETDEPFIFYDEDILQEYEEGKKINYLTGNNEAGQRLLSKISKYRGINGINCRKLTINDLLREAV